MQTSNTIPKFLSSPIAKTLVYANIFISICSLAQVFVTYIVFDIRLDWNNIFYLVFVFSSTYIQYNIQRIFAIIQNKSSFERADWYKKNNVLVLFIGCISLVLVGLISWNLSSLSISLMVSVELLSNLYYLPPFNLKKYGAIKPFIISTGWVISCVFVPLYENNILQINTIWFMVSQFLFISSLCILFDIKDAEEDYLKGVNTYANKFGITITKIISISLMVLSSLCCLFLKHPTLPILIITGITSAITIGSILLTNEKKHTFYYYLWIDGLMIVQALVFLCFNTK